jgi:hypothetical protein
MKRGGRRREDTGYTAGGRILRKTGAFRPQPRNNWEKNYEATDRARHTSASNITF